MSALRRHYTALDILGCIVAVEGTHEALVDGVNSYFQAHVLNELWATPDVIISCDWEKAGRHLFRSRECSFGEPLTGVFAVLPGQTATTWIHNSPPIPPFCLPPIEKRFFGLHAAAVSFPLLNRCVVIVGPKGAGKTTISLDLTNNHGGELLTDENAIFHLRTRLVEPFARMIHRVMQADGGTVRLDIPAKDAVCGRIGKPSMATDVIILDSNSSRFTVNALSRNAFFSLLVKNVVDCCSSYEDVLMSLARVTREVRGISISYTSYMELPLVANAIIDRLRARSDEFSDA